MKRFLALTLATVLTIGMLTACGESSSEASNKSSSSKAETTTTTAQDSDLDSKSETNSSDISVTETQSTILTEPEKEPVVNYYIYAEKGAVITKLNSKTGEFSWKGKCEACGKVDNTLHGGRDLKSNNQKLNTSFVCSNSKCSLWGKLQPVVIGCSVTKE